MKRSNRLILLIGVFLAALAFVFVVVLLGGNGGPGVGGPGASQAPAEADTVVAARDIPLGVTVTAAMVTTEKILVANQEPGALGSVSQAIGKVARQSIARGQQVTTFQFAESSGANLEVPPGFTGIAVQVDQLSGVGTLIKTGDFVDIVAGVSTSDPRFPLIFPQAVGVPEDIIKIPDDAYDHTSVKVLLQGLQVIGTLLPPPPAADTGAPSPAPGSGGVTLNGQQEIVILAVTPQQAEVIKFAQLDGNMTLTLRSPRDFVDENGNPIVPETVSTTGIILKKLITDWGVLPPEIVFTVPAAAAP